MSSKQKYLRPISVVTDTVAPTYSSSEEGDVTNVILAVTFSENIFSPSSDYKAGFTVKFASVTQTISTGARQSNKAVIHLTIAVPEPEPATAITVEYSDVTGDIEDEAGNDLASFAAQATTNNVGTHLWFDNIADNMHLASMGWW